MSVVSLKDLKRLYDFGFAIHWLHPGQKRPIGSGWTTGPRKTWAELKAEHQSNYNVGVRLGTPSKIGKRGYLAAIDVDVKGSKKRHRREAEAALVELIGKKNRKRCPEVYSGRGGGSKHLYCITPEPFKTHTPCRSEETVKYLSPTKSPSNKERAELSEQEIKDGWRFAPAWEISLYSDGRQVVLPDSIHPDTRKPYFWERPLLDIGLVPVIEFEAEKSEDKISFMYASGKTRGPQEEVPDFEVTPGLTVHNVKALSKKMRALIATGEYEDHGIKDRSAFLLSAAKALVCAGLDKNGVLTVLSDHSTFLGECAFEHAKTKSRKRAVKWLWNYSVKLVMDENNPTKIFSGPVEYAKKISAEEAKKQADEIMKGHKWTADLEVSEKGKILASFNNCLDILTHSCEQADFVGRNEFAANDFYLCNAPWSSRKGDAVKDIDIVRIKEYCARNFGVEFNDNRINQALMKVADVSKFHPVRNWIRSLKWDKVQRVETWLKNFAGAQGPDDYLKAVSRKVLVAMVKRVFEPGCKFDHVLILEGVQGSGKSTLLANLAGNEWFSDETLNIGDKDAVLTMQSKWLIELGELSALTRSEVEQMKAFITRRTDRIRAPYGKRVEEFPRQCIFIGSTNQQEYLRDETGNRRFWPVLCGRRIDFNGIKKVREQLFAEAYQYYLRGETLYLEGEALNVLAQAEQEKRAEVDEWYGAIADILSGPTFPRHSFEMRELSKCMDQFGTAHQLSPWDQKRIAKCLRELGYERRRKTIGGVRRKLWCPSQSVCTARENREKLAGLPKEFSGPSRTASGPSNRNSKGPSKNTKNRLSFLKNVETDP